MIITYRLYYYARKLQTVSNDKFMGYIYTTILKRALDLTYGQ